jgi:hypothetical protein
MDLATGTGMATGMSSNKPDGLGHTASHYA